ncbi:MAG: GldG family protein [Acidobacteria bacterium]|nr:GldG family protein [Acidobacteriota bacterium]
MKMPGGVRSRLSSRQAKYGLNTAIYSLLAVAIVIVVNLIANRFVKQVDLTSNQRYSLSQQTRNILTGLDGDVDIIYFDRRQNFDRARDLLELYPALSRRVKLAYVDPDREPGKANQYNVKTYGAVVLAVGERHEQAKAVSEEEITNTVIRLLKGGPKTIYFLTGHGERDTTSTERLGYSEAEKSLQDGNYAVKPLSLLEGSPQVPEDASVLVIAGPRTDLLDPEIEAIKQYIMKGGRALFLINPTTPPKVRALLEEFGADASSNLVVDTSGLGRIFGTDELMPLVLQYEDHPITKDMTNTATLFPLANALQVSGNNMPGAEFKLLAKTTQNSWATKDVQSQTVRFREGQDLQGPLALVGVGTYKNPESTDAAEGRIAVSGSADLISNTVLGFNGNRDLFLNVVNWLASDEDLISIRPKSSENRRVELSSSQMQLVKYTTLVIVPLAVVMAGLGVWWKRRA